jgi:Holliday junction resolvase
LPTATYLILEIEGNGFFYGYSRGASPQIVIDEIMAESLNVFVYVVEVKKTCQQPLYTQNEIEIN